MDEEAQRQAEEIAELGQILQTDDCCLTPEGILYKRQVEAHLRGLIEGRAPEQKQ